MDAFEISELMAQRAQAGEPYLEFLRVPALSLGLYRLAAGAGDPQQPHAEDEVYYVLEGRATVQVGGEDRPVQPGSVVFVAAGLEHRFHSISEDLSLLVFFAPAEDSQTKA
jgi:mannose-6-phosphate isomerase-like protein (cupin superfamily)